MVKPAPKIDRRVAADIARQVEELLAFYIPGWQKSEKDIGAALIGVFARFSEIIIERLNQVPSKNFLAFLNLLGASLLPPEPARASLTFSLTAGTVVDAVVPAGTQVAAPPGEGEKDPVIFETERELVVTSARLAAIFVCDPKQDKYGDYSKLTQLPQKFPEIEPSPPVPAFEGDKPIEHILYLGNNRLLGFPNISALRLNFILDTTLQELLENGLLKDERLLRWEFWNGKEKEWKEKTPDTDETCNLRKSGLITFNNIEKIEPVTVNGIERRWLRCKLMTPIAIETTAQREMVRSSQLPILESIELEVTSNYMDLPLQKAFFNSLPLDLSKDFFPFGEKPKFGDTFYLSRDDAFARSGVDVTLNVKLTNPASEPTSPIPPTYGNGQAKLQWEFWNGNVWEKLNITETEQGETNLETGFEDATEAFTKCGEVTFKLANPQKTVVNEVESYWVRVRLIGGNYGEEASYKPINSDRPNEGFVLEPATLAPPSIESIKVKYDWSESTQELETIACNHFECKIFRDRTPFSPSQAVSSLQESHPKLYFGFKLPQNPTPVDRNKTFFNRNISLYFSVADVLYGEKDHNSSLASSPRWDWAYWDKDLEAWAKLTVFDETEALTRSGLVEFLAPANWGLHREFSLEYYWLRASLLGVYRFPPQLQRVLLNTTVAAQTVTISNEILGASDASENQTFSTIRSPVLKGQSLEVRELEIPSARERDRIEKEEGENAISVVYDSTGRPQEIWVRWHEVSDFYGSEARDRHYVLDRLSGKISFGNGLNGLIPPLGRGNIRMARYQTGGGKIGNRAAGTIVQLKTTVPYIDKVINPEAATGGADVENLDSLLERAPRTIRHGGRAVTVEDYEDLAILASPEVARARCVPLRNLADDPLDAKPIALGEVSVIIVPRSTEVKPLPSIRLLDRVRDYLAAHATSTANISVVGPLYLKVSVKTELAIISLERASSLERMVDETLNRFLHPLTGGFDGNGWTFGRAPHKSDFYALLEAVPGVDRVLVLDITEEFEKGKPEELRLAKRTARFLVYSGKHQIDLAFETT